MSTNTGVAPRIATALAVETNVNGGTITSSPGPRLSSSAAMSSAWVHDVVSSTRGAPLIRSSHWWHWRVNGPSP